jgi:hypothetical protein
VTVHCLVWFCASYSHLPLSRVLGHYATRKATTSNWKQRYATKDSEAKGNCIEYRARPPPPSKDPTIEESIAIYYEVTGSVSASVSRTGKYQRMKVVRHEIVSRRRIAPEVPHNGDGMSPKNLKAVPPPPRESGSNQANY